MSWLWWRQGRTSPQNYEKLTIASLWFFDVYLLRFRKGSRIDWHTDPVAGKEHHRINILVRKPVSGGRIMKKILITGHRNSPLMLTVKNKTRFDYMRSDNTEHAVEAVTEGTAVYLSFGWIR